MRYSGRKRQGLALILFSPRRPRKIRHATLEADDLKRPDVHARGQLEGDVCPARRAHDVDAERGLVFRGLPLGADPEAGSASLAASRRMMHARHGKPDSLLMARYYTRNVGSRL